MTAPADNLAKVDETIAALKEAFSGDPPNLTEAKSLAVQLKYWQGLENAAKEWSPQ
jgi:molecular chaperone HscB